MENNKAIDKDILFRKVFAKRLKRLRIEMDLTLEGLSTALSAKYNINVSYSSLGYYERAGEKIPNLYVLTCIADFFEVTTDYLLGKTDIKNAKVIQMSMFDKENVEHNIKLAVTKDSDLEKMSLKEIKELVSKLKNLGIDFDKIK